MISRLAAELPTKPQARAQLALKISVSSIVTFMASRFLPSAAKGSLGEAIIYKVFWPPFEGEVARRVAQLFYFALAAPWFIAWWGLDRYVRMVDFFVIRGNTFELDYKSILSTISVRGVVHVGANVGQEAATYQELKVPKVVWIEAQEECREPLEATLAKQGRDEDVVAITAISSEAGSAKLFRTDNSISTSLKPLGHGHKSYFPFIQQAEVQDIQTETLDGLFQRLALRAQDFDFMYLDVQGSELDVLQGSREVLPHIRFIVTEISSEEHYKGGCAEKDLHDFLLAHGFQLRERQMPPIGHGNAFYAR